MTTLRPAQHAIRDVTVVEIWSAGILIGTVYPSEKGIRVVSKYLTPEGVAIKPMFPPVLEVDLS